LFYRMLTSESPTHWVNPGVTVGVRRFGSAPFVRVLDAGDTRRPVARRFADDLRHARAGGDDVPAPTIAGPETYDRGAAVGPSFLVRPGAGRYFAVEVAASAARFTPGADDAPHANGANDPGERGDDNARFFASWAAGSPRANGSNGLLRPGLESSGAVAFTLPAAAWRALRNNNTLYYRVVSSDRPDGWVNVRESIVNGDRPPSIRLTGRATARTDRELIRDEEAQWRRD
jgi:hypothetical protein